MKNSSGFTMIELLAAIVVLGILMGSAVPIVMSVMRDQRNDIYIEDALRLAANADNKMRSDNKIVIPPRNGGCVIMSLDFIDNNAFSKGPYDGEYDKTKSFVVLSRNSSSVDEEYTYYVRLLEALDGDGYRGVNLIDINNLYVSDARDRYIENVGKSAAFSLVEYKGRLSFLRDELRLIKSNICPNGIQAIYVKE